MQRDILCLPTTILPTLDQKVVFRLLVMFWTIKYTKPPLLRYLDISVQIFLAHIPLM